MANRLLTCCQYFTLRRRERFVSALQPLLHFHSERVRSSCKARLGHCTGPWVAFRKTQREFLEEGCEEDEQQIPRQRFSEAKSFPTSKIDHPFIFHELSIRIQKPLGPEDFRIAPMIRIGQHAPGAYDDGCVLW